MHHLTAAGRRIAAFYWVGLDWQGTLERACSHLAWPCSTTLLLTVIKEPRTLQACSCAVVQYFSGPRLL